MRSRRMKWLQCRIFCTITVTVFAIIPGCGESTPSVPPPSIQSGDREKLVAALPPGVTLETPIVPDIQYGLNAKTVSDALTSLFAQVRDNTIVDGGMGREIRFEGVENTAAKPGSKKKGASKKGNPIVIKLGTGRGQ